MAQDTEEPRLTAPHQPPTESHPIHPPSPSPSEPEEFLLETSTSRTPSQRPTEDLSTSASTSSPAPSLGNNPDYIALQSSLTLLNAQHRQVVEDMQTLITLKKKALANPAWFKHLVVSGQLAKVVPQKQSVIRCPRVEWEKYGSMGMRLGRELDKPTPVEPLYTVLFGPFTWLIARVYNCFLQWNPNWKDLCKRIGLKYITIDLR